jgi:hypothetical protein
MKNHFQVEKFLIFSDDIEWCKNNFKGPEFYFSENEIDIEDLFLMSLCDNHIISNSSFSWWGSWLCKKEGKKIISPRLWFRAGSNINERDIHTEKMITL